MAGRDTEEICQNQSIGKENRVVEKCLRHHQREAHHGAIAIGLEQGGRDLAERAGILLADTKVELGWLDGRLVLGDEVLTPDSSRFWPQETWQPGGAQPSYDKQYVRDWLRFESGWDRGAGGPPPPLPADVVERTRAKYVEAYERLTGRPFA